MTIWIQKKGKKAYPIPNIDTTLGGTTKPGTETGTGTGNIDTNTNLNLKNQTDKPSIEFVDPNIDGK